MKLWQLLKQIGLVQFLIDTFGPNGIFSSGTEGHAFLIGICEVIAFWQPRHDMPAKYKANGNPIRKEYHYYSFGRACGVFAWIGITALAKFVLLTIF